VGTRQIAGYIFSSEDLAPEIRGFGGKINLGVHVDINGKLISFHIIRSNETPAYLELLSQWRDLLMGRRLFGPRPFADVDAAAGATVSSEAIISALEASSRRFATQILGRPLEPALEKKLTRAARLPDTAAIYLIGSVVLTLVVVYRGGFWSRLSVLLLNLVGGGIVLNAQYSSEQMATVLSLHAPAAAWSGTFLLAVGILLAILLFGNIYCGYICPFGAAQELLGYIVPRRLKPSLCRQGMRQARFIKYVVLFVLVMVFFVSRDRTTLAADPLISFFNLRFAIYDLRSILLWIAATALLGSIFYTRFWCRYLCPVGAFLSLFNNVVLLRRFIPAKKFGRCEFGLTAKDQMDCIYCDKCRYEARPAPKEEAMPRPWREPGVQMSRCFVFGVLVVAALLSAVCVDRFLQVTPAGFDSAVGSVASGGQPRDVDLRNFTCESG
jgi:hypothetical protein